MSLAPITGDGGKLAAQAADQTQKTTPVQEFQGILKNGLSTIKEDMDSIFEEASALYQIPSKLLRAVAKAESGFNPKAVSKAGAMGVMQLMPGTARSLGVSDPYNARQNILGGAKYLKQNLNRFGGDVSLALAAYNAGPGSVTKYGGIPPYKETQNYVKKIMADYTGNNTILAGRTVSTGTYGKTSGSTAVVRKRTELNGRGKFTELPDTSVIAIASPMALPVPKTTAVIIPDFAAGRITWKIVWIFVAPNAREALFK